MKFYIVQCNDKVSSLGYKTFQEAMSFLNSRIINGLSNEYEIDEYSKTQWYVKLKRGNLVEEYKILEIQVNE